MEIVGDAIVDGLETVSTSLTVSNLTANAMVYATTAGLLASTAAATNGQLLIGSTGSIPVLTSLTAGTNITITPGAGTITIAAPNGAPASPSTSVQYNNAGAFAGNAAFEFIAGTNPYVQIAGTSATNQLRVGGSAQVGTATVYIESSSAAQDGQLVYFNSGSAATSGYISYAYDGSTPYLRIADADDDPPYISFATIGTGTYTNPLFVSVFGARGNYGTRTGTANQGFAWYIGQNTNGNTLITAGSPVMELDSTWLRIPSGTTAQRPTPANGMIRYNTTILAPEIYFEGDWTPTFASGSSGFNSNFDDFQTEAIGVTAGTPAAPTFIPSLSKLAWTGALGGTGTAITDTATGTTGAGKAIGVIQLSNGTLTSSTGYCGIGRGNNAMVFGNAYHFMEWRVWIPNLSTGTTSYILYLGFGDNYGAAGDVTDGAYFQYSSASSANWRMCTANAGTRTQTNTTTAVTAAAWIKLGIEVNAAGTLVTYYINGTSVGTIATNIPTANNFGTIAKIEKTGSSGTARTALLDYFSHTYIYTTTR